MEWIDTKDKLPEDSKVFDKYLIVVTWLDTILDKDQWKSFVDVGRFNPHKKCWLNDNETIIDDDENTVVTHWMPLPTAPEIPTPQSK